MATITTVYDHARGCGFRKSGGLYLMSGNAFAGCGKLPIPLTVCPCCNTGIKPARGWTWVSAELIMNATCTTPDKCKSCSPLGDLSNRDYKFGLLWVGEKFYPKPSDFMREAKSQGISRRISAVPRDFDLACTWVLLAHRKAVYEPENVYAEEGFLPGIFSVFKPDRIEYVVKGDESEEELDALEKRGLTLVKVELAEQQINLNL
jgi:hypothetical protein